MPKNGEKCFFTMSSRGEIDSIVDQQGLKNMGPDGYFGKSTSMKKEKTLPPIPPRSPRDRAYD